MQGRWGGGIILVFGIAVYFIDIIIKYLHFRTVYFLMHTYIGYNRKTYIRSENNRVSGKIVFMNA